MERMHIMGLLASESFVDYLEGIHLFAAAIRARTIAQRELDSEIMERATAVVAVEGWAQHEDYVEKLEYFIDQLTGHSDLISDPDAPGSAFRGIVVFINAFAQGKLSSGGFADPDAGDGWRQSELAGELLYRHFDGQGRLLEGLFFKDLGEWFGAIRSAQEVWLEALTEIQDWNESSANGFYNILPMAAPIFQARLLDAIRGAASHPVVRASIFDKYLNVLNSTRDEMMEAGENGQAAEVEKLIDMVLDRRGS
ncbi:MAG: hypothetical protein U0176_08855 [Bacteroidia bacterium]